MEAINYQSIPSDEDINAGVELGGIEIENGINYENHRDHPLKEPPTKGKRILLVIISCTIVFIFYRWYFHPISISKHPFIFTLPTEIIPNPDPTTTVVDLNNTYDKLKSDLLSDISNNETEEMYQFDDLSRFIMKNYQNRKPMSNFLPGIGGKWGKPYWVFYANRGQGIASFGIQNKDGEMLQFQTANIAYQQISNQGFRSFLNGYRNHIEFHYSPFSDDAPIMSCIGAFSNNDNNGTGCGASTTYPHPDYNYNYNANSKPNPNARTSVSRDMHIGMNELEITESNPDIGLDTSVLYYTIAGESFAGLIRSTTFTNTHSESLELDVLDGLASILPPGLINAQMSTMGRTLQAWMNVYNFNTTDTTFREPFYRISQSTADTMQVTPVYEGNYMISYLTSDADKDKEEVEVDLLPIIVDPTVLFEVDTTLRNPSGFYNLQYSEWNSFLRDTIHTVRCSDSREYRVESSEIGSDSDSSSIEHNDGVTVIRIGNDHVGSTLGIKKLVDDRNTFSSSKSGGSGNSSGNGTNASFLHTNTKASKCNYKIPNSIRKLLVDSFTRQPQITVSQTPCAFASTTATLLPGESINIVSIYGHAESLDVYNRDIAPVIKEKSFAARKLEAARGVVNAVVDRVRTDTSDDTLNLYVKQNFLDCELRGGFPFTFPQAPEVNTWIVNASATVLVDPVLIKPANARNVEYVYSRVHGDMERDYNFFQIPFTFFSQGPGNYRDVAQNRRSDVKFEPQTSYQNILLFLNLIQSDGYNPLTVSNPMYRVPTYLIDPISNKLSTMVSDTDNPDEHVEKSDKNPDDASESESGDDSIVVIHLDDDNAGDDVVVPTPAKLISLLKKPFRLGDFFEGLNQAKLKVLPAKRERVVQLLLSSSLKRDVAAYAQNGFWADHWTYLLDMVDSYLSIFPDKEVSLLWGENTRVGFYASPAVVLPRSKRYQLAFDGPDKNPDEAYIIVSRAISAVTEADYPPIKAAAMDAIYKDPDFIVDAANAGSTFQKAGPSPGVGEPFTVDLYNKLVMLAVLKAATVDIEGLGVEMEGGKPGWNDALNGLPGMMGSGMAETYELLRMLRFLKLKILDATKHQLHSDNWNSLRNISIHANGNNNGNTKTILISIEVPMELVSLMDTMRFQLLNILGEYGSMIVRNAYGVDYGNVDTNTEDGVHLASDVDVNTDEWKTYIYNKQSEFNYWDRINIAKEVYRKDTLGTFSGVYTQVRFVEYIELLNLLILKLNSGIHQALQYSEHAGLTPSYFYYRCTDYDVSNANITINNGSPTPLSKTESKLLNSVTSSPHQESDVRITGPCSRKHIPIFLEGIVRFLKTLRPANSPGSGYDMNIGMKLSHFFSDSNPSVKQARDVYNRVKKTHIYDTKLHMYRLSVSLSNVDRNIGRLVAFAPGWLENQSVFLHMSYKYYLELLRNGLFAEFYDEMKHGLVPYINNTVYGRSPLEAASFIVSSAFPSNKLHGNSYLARLSGATAEFISMWDIMTASATPFIMVTNPRGITSMAFCLRPALASYLFHNSTQSLSFTFLGAINVTYINPSMANTWELSPLSYQIHTKSMGDNNDDKPMKYLVVGSIVKGLLVKSIRNLVVSDIVVTLG